MYSNLVTNLRPKGVGLGGREEEEEEEEKVYSKLTQ